MNYEEITYEKCKYCGKPIWNNNRNGYHRKCLIDIEFDENENEAYMENPKKNTPLSFLNMTEWKKQD